MILFPFQFTKQDHMFFLHFKGTWKLTTEKKKKKEQEQQRRKQECYTKSYIYTDWLYICMGLVQDSIYTSFHLLRPFFTAIILLVCWFCCYLGHLQLHQQIVDPPKIRTSPAAIFTTELILNGAFARTVSIEKMPGPRSIWD